MMFCVSVTSKPIEVVHIHSIDGKRTPLHGHTLRVSVKVCRDRLDPSTGFVIDMVYLRKILNDIMKMLDSKIVVGQDVESLGVLENLGEIVRLYIPKATAEYIALYIAHSICREVGENSLYIEVHLEQGGVGKAYVMGKCFEVKSLLQVLNSTYTTFS